MRRLRTYTLLIFLIIILIPCLTACGSSGSRDTLTECKVPSASGEAVYEDGTVAIDYSNASQGYLMIKYSGSSSKIKIQITGPSGTTYTYTSLPGDYQTFPISEGSGSYRVTVFEHVQGIMYSVRASQSISVDITDEFGAFLYPNQYI